MADQRVGLLVETLEGARAVVETGAQRARAQLCTAWRARNSALDPVEQLLLTLKTGIAVIPTS